MKDIVEAFLMAIGVMALGVLMIWALLSDHSKAGHPIQLCTCSHKQP